MIRPVALLASSNIAAQALNLIAYPILTYIYAPPDFGVFGIITSVSVMAGMIVCARLDTIIQIERRWSELHLVRLALVLGISAAFIVGAAAYIAIKWKVLAVGTSDGAPVALAACFGGISFLNGFYAVGSQLQIKFSQYRKVAKSQLFRVAVSILSQVALGMMFGGYWGLLIGFALGTLLATVLVTPIYEIMSGWGYRSILLGVRAARRRRRIIAVDCFNTMISSSFAPLQLVLITSAYGPTGAGLFVFASRLLFAPAQAVGGSLSSVYFQRVAEGVRRRQRLLPLFSKSLAAALGLGLAMALGAGLLLDPFVEMILPTTWAGVAPIGVALLPALVANMILSGVGYTALSLARPHLATVLNIYQIAILGISFGLANWLGLPMVAFVVITSGALLIGALGFVASLFLAIRRHDATVTLRHC